jgi:CHAT domain-containing protein/tetratricopeptide (TPR) repeat protein
MALNLHSTWQLMRPHPTAGLALLTAAWLLAGPRAPMNGETDAPSALLELGKTLERQLSGGESHEYLFALKAGQYARLLMYQHSINLAVECFGPDGDRIFASDSHALGDTEIAQLIGEISGNYRISVTAPDKTAPTGHYTITLSEVVTATDRHKSRVAGARAYAKATARSDSPPRESLVASLANFEDALAHWRAAHDLFEEARTLAVMGLYYSQLGDRGKTLEYTSRALPVAKESRDRRIEAWALTNIGIAQVLFEDKRRAAEYLLQALPLMHDAGDLAGEATIFNYLGRVRAETGESRKALDYFDQALKIYRDLQDRPRFAEVVNNIGITYARLGEHQKAIENYQECLALARQLGNRGTETISLNNIGSNYSDLGQFQKALDSYTAALEISRSLEGRQSVAINLHNIASVYAALGNRRRALKYYKEALELVRAIDDRYSIGNTLNNIGASYGELGDCREALKIHLEALSYRRAVGDADGEAISLTNIGKCHNNLGDRDKARENLERAVAILRVSGRRDRLAAALKSLGALHRAVGDFHAARKCLSEALAISRDIRDRKGEAEGLAEMARVEWDRADFVQACERADEALNAFESIRHGVMSPSLRASLFASVRDVQELKIEALIRLHAQQPQKGFGAAALLASERGRARSLLEMLGEGGTEIRRGVDAGLLARERELQQVISAKAALQVRRLSGKHTEVETAAAEKELDGLTAEFEQVQGRIRATSPQYAALTQPTPLDLSEIQSKVLDDDTVLLEYTLGAGKSFLWAVTRTSMDIYELPARSEIESAARRVYELLTARNQKPAQETPVARAARVRQADEAYFAAARKASEMLLGPAAVQISGKRLLIVGEGLLKYLPFGALPDPGTDIPLIAQHEIVTAPSASVVAVLRQERASRNPAAKTLAVLADPVFNAGDARIGPLVRTALESESDPGVQDFMRLRFSRAEAEEITRLAGPGATLKALDFEASRDTAMKPDLGDYRIVHFATHSLLNNEHPELSGVVLSLVDRNGHPQNGFLRLYDIYNLRLSAELVVLSACRTALGQEIKGEGLIGLTRGFLYAGAPRVVATLWEIDDRTTAEAMKRFYEGLLGQGPRPAEALRAAQIALWRTRGWDAPYYWAAFTLEGEWR